MFQSKGICKMKKLLLLLASVGFYVQASESSLRCFQIGRYGRGCMPSNDFDAAMARNRERAAAEGSTQPPRNRVDYAGNPIPNDPGWLI